MANILNQFMGSFPNLNSNPALLENALSLAQLDPSFASQSLIQLHPFYQNPPNPLLAKRPSPYELPNNIDKKPKVSPKASTPQGLPPYQQVNPSQIYDNLFPFGTFSSHGKVPSRNEQQQQEMANHQGILQEGGQRGRPDLGYQEALLSQLGFPGLGNMGIPTSKLLADGMFLRPELYSLLEGNPGFNSSSLFQTQQNPFGQHQMKESQYPSSLLLSQLTQAGLMGDQNAINSLLNYQKLQQQQEAQLMEQLGAENNFDPKQMQQALRSLQRDNRSDFLLQQKALAFQDPAMFQQLLQNEAQASVANLQNLQRDLLLQKQLETQAQEKLLGNFSASFPGGHLQASPVGLDQQYMNLLLQQQQLLKGGNLPSNDNNNNNKRNGHHIAHTASTPDLSVLNGLSQRKKPEPVKQHMLMELHSDSVVHNENGHHPVRKTSREETKEMMIHQGGPYSEPGSIDRDTGFASGQDNGSIVSQSELKRRNEEINESIFSSLSDRGYEEEIKKQPNKKVSTKKREKQPEPSLATYYAAQKTQERRKNRWQMAQEEKIEVTRVERVIQPQQEEEEYVQKIVNTPLGDRHQVRIPIFELEEKDVVERYPKLRWSPETYNETEWANLVSRLEFILRQTIDEGKLIKLLGENEYNPQKVLSLCQTDPRKYAQYFALKVKKLKFLP